MTLTILGREDRLRHLLPEAAELRITGFQSPAEDEKEAGLSLDSLVGLGAPQIWVVRVDDDSLLGFGMYPGDRLVVDRSARCVPDCYVVAGLDGESQYRVRLLTEDAEGRLVLKAAHAFAKPINLELEELVEIFGMVRWVISYVGR
ncbi:LexA family protein [Stutzerimonas stutzeri]|uniref:S24 family peptidase n=1 Tax=Stutzerimonas stutzeri TaxID=316 RepID=A0A6I6LRQ5_STUST|nr:S24 family peptidase [Stutzerimonas stutzeri]QGZ31477.1 S24 family peptidase [Stutzerimonas stutzeri]